MERGQVRKNNLDGSWSRFTLIELLVVIAIIDRDCHEVACCVLDDDRVAVRRNVSEFCHSMPPLWMQVSKGADSGCVGVREYRASAAPDDYPNPILTISRAGCQIVSLAISPAAFGRMLLTAVENGSQSGVG